MAGKIINATALRVNTVAMDNVVSLSSASIIGAMAAIALPPQMAVPDDMRYELFLDSLNAFPRAVPMHITPMTDIMVNSIPSLPVSTAEYRFIPKPNPMTDSCRRYFDAFFVNFLNGAPNVTAISIPATRERAVGMKNDAASSTMNRILEMFSFIVSEY